MVSNCANPACSVPLKYLRDGRLFQFEVRALSLAVSADTDQVPGKRKGCREISHFWLCGQCASSFTLIFDQVRGVTVVPLRTAADSGSAFSQAAS